MTEERDMIGEAAAWHVASSRDDMDWDAFTLWLEADPAHARAYDEVALGDALLGSLPAPAPALVAANDEPLQQRGSRIGWKRWGGMAIAASLLVLVAAPLLRDDPSAVYRTASQSRTVTLEDGSEITLAPASELTVDADGEHIALSGGALFDIRHDPDRQLVIAAGPVSISDIGTVFDVQVAADDVRVAVSEGQVTVLSDRMAQAMDLVAGRQLHFAGASGRATASAVDGEDVGAWRSGRLAYDAVPLALVSADLSRYAGVQLDVPAELRDRLFSGTLATHDGNAAIRDLAQLMGLGLERDGDRYRLGAAAR